MHLVKMQMSDNRTYTREGRTKVFTFREHGSNLQIKKKLRPWKSWVNREFCKGSCKLIFYSKIEACRHLLCGGWE